MKKITVVFFLLFTLLFLSKAQAGKDPVAWSLSPAAGFPAQTSVGSTYAVVYTITNRLPFSVPLTIEGKYTGGKFALTTNCDKTLIPNATCLIHLSFQPIKAGTNSAAVILAYHKNRVPLPTLSSTSTSNETSDKISGHVSQPLPPVTYVGVSYPVTFTFINNGNSSVTATAVNVTGFTPVNGCSSPLLPHNICTVTGTFTPSTTGAATLSVTYVYSNGSVPLSTQTIVHTGSGSCHHISADVTLPLPTATYIYANNLVQYTFTNNCVATSESLGNVIITTDSTSDVTILPGSSSTGTDTCSNTVLGPSSSCSIYVSVIPTATTTDTDLSVTAKLYYNSNTYRVEATTSEDVNPLTNQNTLHTLMFVNQCVNNTVWYAFGTGGSPDPTPPNDQTWQGYQLNPQIPGAAPAVKILQFSQYNGGSIAGRTGCDTTIPKDSTYGVCNTGNCTSLGNTTGTCTFTPHFPTTIFEEDIVNTAASDGVYDISLINGFNIPGEFRSLAPTTVTHPFDFTQACGRSAGAVIQPRGPNDPTLGGCLWSFTPPSTGTDCTAGTQTDTGANYYFVPPGSGDGCTASSTPQGSCASATDVCGMAWTPQPASNPQYLGTPISRRCGPFLGYWTVADWVGFQPNSPTPPTPPSPVYNWDGCDLYSHYSMATTLDSIKPSTQPTYGYSQLNPNLSPNLPPAALADLFACKPTSPTPVYVQPNGSIYSLNSGYDVAVNACGCHDWNNTSTTPVNAQTAQDFNCKSFNSLFTNQVYNRILWLKEACPTAYSYQFDDASSQFTCNTSGQFTSYQITFCPGGKSGAPGT